MSDNTIDKQVIDQLYWDDRIEVSDVAVTVDKGWVKLTGHVPSYKAKRIAAEDAYLVHGVKFVDNHITVKYDADHSDKMIKENVEFALDWEWSLDTHKITTSVKDGTVELTGTVNAYWKKILAGDIAYDTHGVLEVKNELAIVTSNKFSDEIIAGGVEAALVRNLNVDVNDVNVKVNKGKVTLSGKVPNWTAKYAADNCAVYTVGVKSVHNEITIL